MHKRTDLSLDSRFKLGFLINTSFMIFEFLVGLATGSLILIADAAHNLTDSATLAISFVGNKLALKPADDDHSLGHGRASVLAAFINSVILVLVAGFIFFEAYQRFQNPQPLEGGVIAVVGAVGILANGTVAFLFRKNRDDLNVKAAYTNMLFDALFSIAALTAGVLIVLTGKTWIDPLISIGVGIGLLYAAFGILAQATHIFLEGVPKNVNLEELKNSILETMNVEEVSDVVAWSLSSNEYILCCSVKLQNTEHEAYKKTIESVKKRLKDQGFSQVFIELQ